MKLYSQDARATMSMEGDDELRRLLARFPFVKAVWGRSAPVDRCVEFIRGDDFLRSHERCPDIFIDDVNDPVRFYCDEVQGRLGGRPREARATIRALLDRITHYGGDDLLERHLRAFRKDRPLIVLDSPWEELGSWSSRLSWT